MPSRINFPPRGGSRVYSQTVGGFGACLALGRGGKLTRVMYAELIRTLPFEPPPAVFSAVREPPGERVNAEPKLVFVIDDEQDLLDVTTFVLENEGYRVQTAKNGADALSLLCSGTRPELVLLDMMMPVMNGWEFLEAIAQMPSLRRIPIVVMTAAGSIGVSGATAVLRKPFDLGVLVEVVERHAGRAE